MNLLLTRGPPAEDCTLGKLSVTSYSWYTLEPPWLPDLDYLGGTPLLSCVPPGVYALIPHDSVKHPRTFALSNPDLGVVASPASDMRDDVLIHSGNVLADTEGCIILGLRDGMMYGQDAVLESQPAIAEFRIAVPWVEGHTVSILEATE